MNTAKNLSYKMKTLHKNLSKVRLSINSNYDETFSRVKIDACAWVKWVCVLSLIRHLVMSNISFYLIVKDNYVHIF